MKAAMRTLWEVHTFQKLSLRNSRQEVINIQDKVDKSVFILKVGGRWVKFFICWKLQAIFPFRANASIKISSYIHS